MGIIGTSRVLLGEAQFKAFGWRIPFLLSFILLGVSLYIRLKMKESPLFTRMKSSGKASLNPLRSPSPTGSISSTSSWRCSARRLARAWSGTRGNFTL